MFLFVLRIIKPSFYLIVCWNKSLTIKKNLTLFHLEEIYWSLYLTSIYYNLFIFIIELNEIDPLKMHLYRGEGNGGLSIGETPALKSFS